MLWTFVSVVDVKDKLLLTQGHFLLSQVNNHTYSIQTRTLSEQLHSESVMQHNIHPVSQCSEHELHLRAVMLVLAHVRTVCYVKGLDLQMVRIKWLQTSVHRTQHAAPLHETVSFEVCACKLPWCQNQNYMNCNKSMTFVRVVNSFNSCGNNWRSSFYKKN